jgi:hypothetical protein
MRQPVTAPLNQPDLPPVTQWIFELLRSAKNRSEVLVSNQLMMYPPAEATPMGTVGTPAGPAAVRRGCKYNEDSRLRRKTAQSGQNAIYGVYPVRIRRAYSVYPVERLSLHEGVRGFPVPGAADGAFGQGPVPSKIAKSGALVCKLLSYGGLHVSNGRTFRLGRAEGGPCEFGSGIENCAGLNPTIYYGH